RFETGTIFAFTNLSNERPFRKQTDHESPLNFLVSRCSERSQQKRRTGIQPDPSPRGGLTTMGRRIEIAITQRGRAREHAGCVRYPEESAAHPVLPSLPRLRENLPPVGAPGGGCSGCKFGGWPDCGASRSIQSRNAAPRGKRPGMMLQTSALLSMIVTFGSPEMATRLFAALPRNGPAAPK